ncbi:uncharacterized protein Nmlp_1623 [Natronomonas moolapensis 8.8.11]|uniref:Uncharacterized protein n=1 Tax=Natronomonas moolapensis (strain DSM 18674 / CECT 7526 / JCM 14361 / 8.8.11) TaxID=268739 RepID=M1Y056_NATM8|nr:hypothetical protein [Natronomonas moolapensis]CCQ35822.1 uncharacterized protein Nmlp_1623 [Natronomonas moolapensis 8.8.11]
MSEKEIERDELQQLTANELFYVLNGKPPKNASNSNSQLRENIENKKIGQITDRFFNLIEDLAALQYAGFCDDEYWSDIKSDISNPGSDNLIYSEGNKFFNKELIDESTYIIGMQLGHLADLLTYSAQLDELAEEKNIQEALINGFSLGVNGYGTSRPVESPADHDDRVRERLINRSPINKSQTNTLDENIALDGKELAENKKATELVDELVGEAVVEDDDPILARMEAEFDDAGIRIEPYPPVINKVFNLGDGHPPDLGSETERTKYAVECLKQNYTQNIQNVFAFRDRILNDIGTCLPPDGYRHSLVSATQLVS